MTESTPASHWWRTGVTEVAPNIVRLRGYPIEQLIGGLDFTATIWLMLRGELPTPVQRGLLDAVLVATVDHGPISPSAATVRMAVTCGIGLNAALASAIGMLGDHHGGAGQQCSELLTAIAARMETGLPSEAAIQAELDARETAGDKRVPGFGKHQHKIDPRAQRLLDLMQEAAMAGVIDRKFLDIAIGLEAELHRRKNRVIPLNIDGATAMVLTSLGFSPHLARGLFILGRLVGLMAHADEELGRGTHNKSPIPRGESFDYEGPAARNLP